ncbi:MAG: oligoendopeptidase F [Chloroflexi bacterium]|nr:oligoendopeptidase F [Chloroflexota bacterium]
MPTTLPARSEISKDFTWNAESVFADQQAFEAEVASILAALPKVREFQGRLKEGPSILTEAFLQIEDLMALASRVFVYAGFAYSVDTGDQSAAAMSSQAQAMYGQLLAASSFLNPELIAIGHETLTQWMQAEPRLAIYGPYFANLFRKQAHVRSAEVEEVLGMLSDPFGGAGSAASLLTNADMKIPAVVDSQGAAIELNEAIIWRLMSEQDRGLRQRSWDNYHETLLGFKNTLAENLATSIKQSVFQSRVRKHENVLEMKLSENNIPVSVFHNLLETFKKNLPTWHRYFEIRRKALGVETLEPYDMWAPLVRDRVKIPYAQAVELISEGLLPMGKDYVGVLRNGCLEDRWVDVYPNKGKRSGAFSWGSQGTHPFIMISYTDEIFSLSTLAHELGHSMHSYLTWQNQPFVYSEYSLFAAEVASNFHQAMVRAHLLKTNPDRNFQISVIEEAMSNFYRYFFIMPTLARFELETHTRVEQGQPLTADALIELMADLFSEGFGGKVNVNREQVGITWARFGHLYSDYYVYAYATGIAGANALAGRVLRGEANAVQDYLGFLKAGSSAYPLDALQRAGVDLTTPQPVDAAFAIMADYVDRLEKLLG